MVIQGASGWGDQLYIYPVVREVRKKHDVTVITDYPEVFEPLKVKTISINGRKSWPDMYLNYCGMKRHQESNVWQNTLQMASIVKGIDVNSIQFTLDFPEYDYSIKKNVLIRMPYLPTWCKSDDCFVPSVDFFEVIKKTLSENGFICVLVSGNLTTKEWYSLYNTADIIICQSNSNMVFAEMTGKKCACIFNHKSAQSKNWFVSTVTPKKVIIKPETTKVFFDNESAAGTAQKIIDFIGV